MEPVLKLNEFFVEGGNQKQSHVLLHITEPSMPIERQKGYFFAVCEIGNAEPKQLIKLQNIVENLENRYYETPDTEDKSALETVLEKINHDAFSLIRPDISLNCLVGTIRPPEIMFSFHGHPQILLFYKNKAGEYKKMDLVAADKDETATPHLFSQIVQGKINPDDYLLISTPHVINYFDHDRIYKIITTRDPQQSAEHLEKTLSGLKNGFSFGGLIIHLTQQKAPADNFPSRTARKNAPASSANTLFITEQKTADTLSPSLLQRLNQKMKGSLLALRAGRTSTPTAQLADSYRRAEVGAEHLRQYRPAKPPHAKFNKKFLDAVKTAWEIMKYGAEWLMWFALLAWGIIHTALRILILLFFVATNYQGRRRNILNGWSTEWRNYKEYFRHLPATTKIFGAASLLIVLIITFSTVFIYSRQREISRNKIYAEIIENIKTKKDSAESALIYNNEGEARRELEEAKTLLAALPCASEAEKINCDKISKQLEDLFVKMRRVVAVKVILLSDWSGGESKENAKRIFKINKKIVGYGPDSSTVFIYDLLTRESRILQNKFGAQGFKSAAVPKENDYAALLYGKNELARFDPSDNSIKKIEVTYPNDDADIGAIVIYSRRLYALDTTNNQIYRHDSISGGFDLGKEWLKDKTVLAGGRDLMIEGDVYALKSDGQILRFAAGRILPFTATGIDPPLTNGDQIWSYNDIKYIYVLDGAGKRLLLLDKSGQLKAQLTSPVLQNPTGMVIDEENKTAYVVDSNKLYLVTLP